MTSSFSLQAVAFSLAAVVTLGLLGSVSGLADRQYDSAAMAQAPVDTLPMQQVVIVAKRLPRAA